MARNKCVNREKGRPFSFAFAKQNKSNGQVFQEQCEGKYKKRYVLFLKNEVIYFV